MKKSIRFSTIKNKGSVDFFSFVGMTEEKVVKCFDEETSTWEELPRHHVFFEKQNVIFVFDDNGLVENIGIFEGNEFLGIKIEGEYNETTIIEQLGEPDLKKSFFRGNVNVEHIDYFVDGEFMVTFFKDFRFPFSANVTLIPEKILKVKKNTNP